MMNMESHIVINSSLVRFGLVALTIGFSSGRDFPGGINEARAQGGYGVTGGDLWDASISYPALKDIPDISGVSYHLVHQRTEDFQFLHEPRLEFHSETLFVNFSNAPIRESEPAQIMRGRRSTDRGVTWSDIEVVAPGFPDSRRHETAPMLSFEGRLWVFVGRYDSGSRTSLGMELYELDHRSGGFRPIAGSGFVDDFIPFVQPQRMSNGNWIIAGHADGVTTAAVAVSDGPNLLKWRVNRIGLPYDIRYPETALMIHENEVVAVIRNARNHLWALSAKSYDYGQTFTPAAVSNLPMAESKPFAGTLSTGQRYLIYNGIEERNALLISVTNPGELLPLRRTWKIIEGVPEALAKKLGEMGVEPGIQAWAYPEAVENDGYLYVVFSHNKDHCWLAKFPVASLGVAEK